ncbi:hypothetical protein [Brachybacterium sacelli]|uniref:DNA-binding response regulator n=1 Tax=Brachybacterium sacelli TaxID=173364 RepID=A0ABS4WX47_9MICO|nr:hypothetical protein [Brachybacterium sacelli]MBP2380666.1 hypothetical protein [Brachybacterium sacelli]
MNTLTTALDAALETMLADELTESVGAARTVAELLEMLALRDDDLTDQVLHALLSRVGSDPQARELLLHIMGPALRALARKHTRYCHGTKSPTDAFCTVVEAFYDALATPSVQAKTTRVAARITGQTRTELARLIAEERASRTAYPPHVLDVTHSRQSPPGGSSAHESQMALLEGLAQARERQVISQDEARFLLAVHSPGTGLDLVTDCRLGGLSPAAVRKRSSRLVRRLAEAVSHDDELRAGMVDAAA